jgi:hypothetical protein
MHAIFSISQPVQFCIFTPMSLKIRLSLFLLFLCCFLRIQAQDGAVNGRVMDEYGRAIVAARIEERSLGLSTTSDSLGQFQLVLPPGRHLIDFTHPDYNDSREEVSLAPGITRRIYTKMEKSFRLEDQVITDTSSVTDIEDPDRAFTRLIPINPKKIAEITGLKSDLSSKLATIGFGVSQSNEFSSQYRVRGGNFDENLVYVNDVEVYRPFLVRAGQQEGLGFVNPNLASEVGFSSGGFQAKYADKLSSVLDVVYTSPDKFHGTVEMGILNQNMHFEGSVVKPWTKEKFVAKGLDPLDFRSGRFTYLVGGRRFTPAYALGSQDTKGEYRPRFHDVQGMLTFSPRHELKRMRIRERKDGDSDTLYLSQDPLKFSFLFNFANNDYIFTPQSRETSFGTVQNVLRLRVGFQGQDISAYTTGLGAFTVEHRPHVRLRMKYIFTAFRTVEAELFEVEGGYFLSDVNTNFGSEDFNETSFDRGIGTFYRRGRNYLTADVLSAEMRGDWFSRRQNRHKITWGLRYQNQRIDDQLNEWNATDSSGYFSLTEQFKNNVIVNSYLVKAFVQDHWKVSRDQTVRFIYGGRVIYNSLSNELLFAPRLQLVIDPGSKVSEAELMDEGDFTRSARRNYQLRFAAGVYHQPLFYRELRDYDGSLNLTRPAQTSYHAIAGGDYLFKIWNRPFKLTGEVYYKYMTDLVPFEVDNVRIRYYPFNNANGYAYGADARVTGQFIKGIDSWMNIGILSTRERILELDQGYVRRPTDQRVQFSTYFQDELPINPTYKVHINFVYGSGLRFGPPRNIENRTVFGVPSYQRVDLGFSKIFLVNTQLELEDKKFGIESVWVSAEIFNLFQRANTVSYTWIQDVYNTQFAVPNFLSTRLLNLRVLVRF